MAWTEGFYRNFRWISTIKTQTWRTDRGGRSRYAPPPRVDRARFLPKPGRGFLTKHAKELDRVRFRSLRRMNPRPPPRQRAATARGVETRIVDWLKAHQGARAPGEARKASGLVLLWARKVGLMSLITPHALWLIHREALGGKSAVTGADLPQTLDDCSEGVQASHYEMTVAVVTAYGDRRTVPVPSKVSPERALEILTRGQRQGRSMASLAEVFARTGLRERPPATPLPTGGRPIDD